MKKQSAYSASAKKQQADALGAPQLRYNPQHPQQPR